MNSIYLDQISGGNSVGRILWVRVFYRISYWPMDEILNVNADTDILILYKNYLCFRMNCWKIIYHRDLLHNDRHFVWNVWCKCLQISGRVLLSDQCFMLIQILTFINATKLRNCVSRPTFFSGMTTLSHKVSYGLAIGHDYWFSSTLVHANKVTWDKHWAIEAAVLWMLTCGCTDVICHSSENWDEEWLY